MRRAVFGLVGLVLLALPLRARAIDVELREGELALSVAYPLSIEAMFVTQLADLPVSIGLTMSPLAEGGGVSVGIRPLLTSVNDYRLVWASDVGPVIYGRDGAAGGVRAVTEFINTFSLGEARLALTPRVDFSGAWGEQSAWRLRTTLVLAVGWVNPIVGAWVQGEVGYTFDGDSAGAFRLGAALVLSFRPGALQ